MSDVGLGCCVTGTTPCKIPGGRRQAGDRRRRLEQVPDSVFDHNHFAPALLGPDARKTHIVLLHDGAGESCLHSPQLLWGEAEKNGQHCKLVMKMQGTRVNDSWMIP